MSAKNVIDVIIDGKIYTIACTYIGKGKSLPGGDRYV